MKRSYLHSGTWLSINGWCFDHTYFCCMNLRPGTRSQNEVEHVIKKFFFLGGGDSIFVFWPSSLLALCAKAAYGYCLQCGLFTKSQCYKTSMTNWWELLWLQMPLFLIIYPTFSSKAAAWPSSLSLYFFYSTLGMKQLHNSQLPIFWGERNNIEITIIKWSQFCTN